MRSPSRSSRGPPGGHSLAQSEPVKGGREGREEADCWERGLIYTFGFSHFGLAFILKKTDLFCGLGGGRGAKCFPCDFLNSLSG